MTEKKKCSKCKIVKSLDEFNKKGEGKQPFCRECNRVVSRQYYANNTVEHRKNTYLRCLDTRTKNKQRIKEIKLKNGCALCGEGEPVCLDFHHLRDKKFLICEAVHRGIGWNVLVEEIKKCILVCANCHRKIHAGLLQPNENMQCVI